MFDNGRSSIQGITSRFDTIEDNFDRDSMLPEPAISRESSPAGRSSTKKSPESKKQLERIGNSV